MLKASSFQPYQLACQVPVSLDKLTLVFTAGSLFTFVPKGFWLLATYKLKHNSLSLILFVLRFLFLSSHSQPFGFSPPSAYVHSRLSLRFALQPPSVLPHNLDHLKICLRALKLALSRQKPASKTSSFQIASKAR